VLAFWGSCAVADITRPFELDHRPSRLILTDIDLSSSESVRAVRKLLAASKVKGRPHLCVLRGSSTHAGVQANAIGATASLPADMSPGLMRAKIAEILDAPDVPGELRHLPQRLRRDVSAASGAMADLLAAAATGGPLPLGAIDTGVAAINRATEESDLGDWLSLVRQHDDLTYQHCLLVSGLAAAFGRALGFSDKDRGLLTAAAVLHDIGKARIPLAILKKEGELAAEERAVMRRHTEFGHGMLLRQGGFGGDILDAVLSHHEYLDGSGYPHGLRGTQISDLVRMVTICDIHAALIERRSYKAPMAPVEAFGVLMQMAQGKLDRALLRAFEHVALASSDPAFKN
jgi:putative nucleotidyltransferase with HDIG domain